MANYRIPGPLFYNKRQPWPIDDGTLARWLMPPPNTICAMSFHYPSMDLRNCLSLNTEPDLAFLFRSCCNPVMGLSETDYSEAAALLGVEVAAIKAVSEVETKGKAFDELGRPRILYERHYFHRLTSGKYSAKYAHISNARSGGYGKFSAQYGKLEQAFNLDPNAALQSASWGRFQIMGKYFHEAGFSSVRKFVLAMTKSESEHLKAFVSFVNSSKTMLVALRKKQWAAFAAAYNGAGYKKNNYDKKMEEAYSRILKEDSEPRKKT
jgi:hypothetical protein